MISNCGSEINIYLIEFPGDIINLKNIVMSAEECDSELSMFKELYLINPHKALLR